MRTVVREDFGTPTQRCHRCCLTKATGAFDVRADTGRSRSICRECRRAYQRSRYAPAPPRPQRLAGGPSNVLRCTRCGLEKTLDQFPPVRRGEPRLQSWCRACFAEVNERNYQPYYERERTRIQRRLAGHRAEIRRQMVEYLLEHPCVDCGLTDIVVLEFDHIADKVGDVSTLAGSGRTWARITAEIEKCEVRCANCHRKKTAERRVATAQLTPGDDLRPARHSLPVQLLIDALFERRACRSCGETRPLSDFPFRSIRNQTRQWICKPCQRVYTQAWYARNRKSHIARTRISTAAQRNKARTLVRAYLREHSCVDCGESDLRVLEFDHVRGKNAEISILVSTGQRWAVISAEIAKCEVRCANCHRRRTVRQIGGYRTKEVILRPGEDSNLRPAVP